jgi:hypothetical protein
MKPQDSDLDGLLLRLHRRTVRRLHASYAARVAAEARIRILSRRPGRGKTQLAVAIGYRAIQNAFTARFVGANALIGELGAASRGGCLREATAAGCPSAANPSCWSADPGPPPRFGNHRGRGRRSRKRPDTDDR